MAEFWERTGQGQLLTSTPLRSPGMSRVGSLHACHENNAHPRGLD
jgi:hypothetical protein